MSSDMLREKTSSTIAKGKRELFRGLDAGEIESAWIAEDTDPAFQQTVVRKLQEKGIRYEIKGSMKELQSYLKIEVACGVIGFKKLSLNCDKGNFEK